MPSRYSADLSDIGNQAIEQLTSRNSDREVGLSVSREVIRSSANAIRAVHRSDFDEARRLIGTAETRLQDAEHIRASNPSIYNAGFLNDARKEFTEANVTLAVISGNDIPSAEQLGIDPSAYRNGMAEVIGELRRYILDSLRRAESEELVVLPLYPQRSETTTGSTEAAIREALARCGWRVVPRFVESYHLHPSYLAALEESVREQWAARGRGERLLLSFHGLPKRYCERGGDPYAAQCHATARDLARMLGCESTQWAIGFQSRMGRGEWLRPYTDELLVEWGRQGIRHGQVLCPGFAADCLETLEEIAIGEAARFSEAGGGRLDYIPALNERPRHIEALADLVLASR